MSMNEFPAQAGRQTPGEIARRALKTLAERRLVPTPDRFAEVYFEIAGVRQDGGSAAAVIKDLLRDLARTHRISPQEASQIQERVARQDWPAVREAIDEVLPRRAGAAAGNWPQLALALLRQADTQHANWTRARKLDAVGRVLEAAHGEPEIAFDRLKRLVESWGTAANLPSRSEEAASVAPAGLPAGPVAEHPGVQPAPEAGLALAQAEAAAWKEVAMRAIALVEQSCGEGSAAAQKLAGYCSQHASPTPPAEVGQLVPRFAEMAASLDRQIKEQLKVRAGLQRLLGLLCDNMNGLTPEDGWLTGQLEPIRALLGGPVKAQQVADTEVRVTQVIQQQAGARKSLQEAKSALKEMLATLIERVGTMGSSTGRFYDQVGAYQTELEKANDIETLSRVAKGLLADTQAMRADIGKGRDELIEARRKVETYEQRMRHLEKELTQVSSMVQKDPLTHALNRRGIEEAFRVETARATRYGTELSLAMIDLDNFKMINDSLGHLAGDRALVHLLTVMQATLRPTDVVARVGGEEFAILFSATGLEAAVAATQRVQAELARRAFMHDGQPHTLTFSAGAALWQRDESLDSIVQRADEAMYQAKRAGKNRVLRAG
jgi:diguanylate cyclase